VRVESSEIARLALKRMDRHEAESYEGGGSETFTDPDGGLLRYGAALRRVLAICAKWDQGCDHGERQLLDQVRQAIGYEMGVTEAPPEGSDWR
jgi:hypothetical protein